jgi:hypothetical protein
MNKLEQKEIPEQKGSRENPYDLSEYHRSREEHFEKNPDEAFSFKGYITSQRDKKLRLYDLTAIDNDRSLEGKTLSDKAKMERGVTYSNTEYSRIRSLQGEATGPTFSVRAGGKLFEFRCSEEITEPDVREKIVESVYRHISFNPESLTHGEMDDDQFSNQIGDQIRIVLDGLKEETKGKIDYSNFYIRRHKIENREI